MSPKHAHRLLQTVIGHPIIAIKKTHKFSLGLAKGHVPGMRLPLVFQKRDHLYALIEIRVMSQHSQRLVSGRIVDTHHLNIAKRLPTQRLKALG